MTNYVVPLYRAIASSLDAMQNCVKYGNDEWHTKHGKRLVSMNDVLPSGSGFDSGSKIDLNDSKPDRLIIHTSFHHMDEYGGYDGWTDHSIVVTPSLIHDFNLRVTGKDRNEIKDYIAETFEGALREKWNVLRETLQVDVKQETT